jgi:4-hydroxy-tetrahydrodipicolinate reductase
MGRRLVALAADDPGWSVVAALEAAGHRQLGEDAGVVAGIGPIGVPLAGELPRPPDPPPDVVIDFSVPAATLAVVRLCQERRLPLVVATTGLEEPHRLAIREAAAGIPILCAPSMSLAANLAMKLAEVAGRALADHPTGADVEIIERHHRFKEDAPSGTALHFGKIIADAMGQRAHRHGREGRPGPRPHGEIGYHAVRAGDNPGEHTIVFGLLGETLEIAVRASSRDCYALGALAAARFLVQKKPGQYTMSDVLGL